MITVVRAGSSLFLLLLVPLMSASCEKKGYSYPYEFCVRYAACIRPGWGMNSCDEWLLIDQGFRRARGTLDLVAVSAVDCLMNAEDCEAMQACRYATPELSSLCEGTESSELCSGDILVRCKSDPQEPAEVTDCAAAGLICLEGEHEAACGQESCDPDQHQTRCEGDLLIGCNYTTALFIVDCKYGLFTSLGGTCTVDQYGQYVCAGEGDTCDTDDQSYCDGAVMVRCSNGKLTRIKCQDLHPEYVCREESGTEGCHFKGTECIYESDQTCENGMITFCSFGHILKVDCKDHGYSGCATEKNVTDATVAYCVR